MFCVGFGSSLTASAADFSADASQDWYLLPFTYFLDGSVEGSFCEVSHTFNAVSSSFFNNDTFIAYQVSYNVGSSFPTLIQGRQYLLYYNISFPLSETFSVLDFNFENAFYFGKSKLFETSGIDMGIASTSGIFSFSPTNSFAMNTSSSIDFNLSVPFTSVGRCIWAFYLLDVTDNSESEVNQIIAAIQDQTSDIQQSIEDQYGGDPGSSFPVDDLITQHNEKMGVLSFSSDALMQVLGLLSPDQTLSSELVFPSMSLTIASQRNRVQLWPEYRFDLNTLKQHWPDFIGLMQSLTSALVWIFVLRYCYRVFEKYFLAGGGN